MLATIVAVALGLAAILLLASRAGEVWALGRRIEHGAWDACGMIAGAAALATFLAVGARALELCLGSPYNDEVRDHSRLFARPAAPSSARPSAIRLVGPLLLAVGLVAWISEPVAAGDTWARLLPPTERSCTFAGLAAWALGITLIASSTSPTARKGASRSW
jgi:hypothetical protein